MFTANGGQYRCNLKYKTAELIFINITHERSFFKMNTMLIDDMLLLLLASSNVKSRRGVPIVAPWVKNLT